MLNDIKILLYVKLDTIEFHENFNAYSIATISSNQTVYLKTVDSLIFPHPLSIFTALNEKFIPLINNERVEF